MEADEDEEAAWKGEGVEEDGAVEEEDEEEDDDEGREVTGVTRFTELPTTPNLVTGCVFGSKMGGAKPISVFGSMEEVEEEEEEDEEGVVRGCLPLPLATPLVVDVRVAFSLASFANKAGSTSSIFAAKSSMID